MEKNTPHHCLSEVQDLVAAGKVRTTYTALASAAGLGTDLQGMCSAISALEEADFYKSMTSHYDESVWQDVYKPSTPYGVLYLKLTVSEGVLVLSFKEK